MSADSSRERAKLAASLARMGELASGISAMQEAVDQLTLLQSLTEK